MSDERRIDEVVAGYVRAADHRDGTAMTALFTEDAVLEIHHPGPDGQEVLATLHGAEAIGQAVADLMPPHPPGGWSHHTTTNPLVELDGDDASIDVQFLVLSVQAAPWPASGWPPGAAGAQGTITPIESGYLRSDLRRVDGTWKITHHVITHDLPHALPAA